MINGADVYCATGIQRVRAVTMRKYDMRKSSGEVARHLSEVDNKHCISRTFPLSSLGEMKAFGELFMLQDHIQWGANETPDESGLLHEFFLPNAIRPTTLTTLEYNEEGQRSHWIHKPALNFYAVLKASDVKNVGLMKDKNDARAMLHGPEYVSVSVTYPMSTDADKYNFSRSIGGCALVDFMHPHSRIYLTNWLVAVNHPAPQQPSPQQAAEAAVVVAVDRAREAREAREAANRDADEQMAEAEADAEAWRDGRADREAREAAADADAVAPREAREADDESADSDNGLAVESDDDDEEVLVEGTDDEEAEEEEADDEEADDQEADDADPNQVARDAVRELSNTLFEHKEVMSEHAYVQLSNALKRTHEQISS